MLLKRYLLKENEEELREIERDLAKHLGVASVHCEYDGLLSHKDVDQEELNCRKNMVLDGVNTNILDFIINYEVCSDDEVHELHYLKGNGDYIVITGDNY